ARTAMGGPARMADACMPFQRLLLEPVFKKAQLARRAAAMKLAVFKSGDTRRVIAPIFEPLQRIHDLRRNRLLSQNSDDPAHKVRLSSRGQPIETGPPPGKSRSVSDCHRSGYGPDPQLASNLRPSAAWGSSRVSARPSPP